MKAGKSSRSSQILTLLLFVAFLVLVCRYLFVFLPYFGGVDFFYYALNAINRVDFGAVAAPNFYSYFPGAYWFWMIIYKIFGANILAFQLAFAGVLILNALLIADLLRCVTKKLFWGVLGAIFYLSFCISVESHEMTSEPLATLVFLAGLCLAYRQKSFDSWPALAFLGTGLGLAIFTKQTAMLLSMTYVGLFWPLSSKKIVRNARALFLAAIITVATIFLAFLIEGGGLEAIKIGLFGASSYASQGSFLTNVMNAAVQPMQTLFWSGIGIGLGLLVCLPEVMRRLVPHEVSLYLGVTCGWLANHIHFFKRSYKHYTLMGLPLLIISVLVGAFLILQIARQVLSEKHRTKIAQAMYAFLILGVSLCLAAGLWRFWLVSSQFMPLVIQRPLENDLKNINLYQEACRDIAAHKKLILLPSRRNGLHWACRTHAHGTAGGYAFSGSENPAQLIEEISKEDSFQVFIFDRIRPGTYEDEVFTGHDWRGFYEALDRLGYQKINQYQFGILYKRELKSGERE